MNTPWYRKTHEYVAICDEVDQAIDVILSEKGNIYAPEIRSFDSFQRISTVYESNLIEDAGLPKEATRKIISENFPSIPVEMDFFKGDVQKKIATINKDVKIFDGMFSSKSIKPSITFKNKNRDQLEVLQHYNAIDLAWRMATITSIKLSFEDLPANIRKQIVDKLKDKRDPLRLNAKDGEYFTEGMLKAIHLALAKDLLPKDAGVEAGEYRIDERGVGDDTIKFPAPELVKECIRLWLRQTNASLLAMHKGEISPFRAAAEISYKLVWIHPFPDFNGRISRIMMNYVLRSGEKFIHVDLRGGSKNKHQYMTALRRANRGDLSALEALIAKRRSEILTNLKKNLLTEGYHFK
ncbi:MAG: Fic family protein [Fibrobacteres bacterium]|nr:Fic family protein [Fibrobacterota bacterium]